MNGSNWKASRPLAMTAALAVALLWAYWPTFAEMAERWSSDPQYSHGYLVPAFAGLLLWQRRALLPALPWSICGWGASWMAAAFVLRCLGGYTGIAVLDAFSLLPMLLGLALWLGGAPLLRWSWPAILFLVFMLPLPFRVETALAGPLRALATTSSTYIMQTLGLPAVAQGNVIHIDEARIGVVEACSGLSMLIVFIALAVGVAFLVHKPLWEKALIVASAIPIALIANVIRITVTGMLHVLIGGATANAFFHDFAGWLMMPLALLLLWLELAYLSWLVPASEEESFAPPRRSAFSSPLGELIVHPQ